MEFAVFLRGANVGGNTLKTKAVAEALTDLGVKNLGAAGTFRVRNGKNATAVAAAFKPHVPPGCDILAIPFEEVTRLVEADPLASEPRGTPFVTVLASRPKAMPPLPVDAPPEGPWQVRLLRVEGPFALSVRDAAPGKFYPNDLVERALGVRGTTRTWKTLVDLARLGGT